MIFVRLIKVYIDMNIKIKFKNGSYIVPVESKDNMRSKRAEDQFSKQFQCYENEKSR